jgi:hypothetical protein
MQRIPLIGLLTALLLSAPVAWARPWDVRHDISKGAREVRHGVRKARKEIRGIDSHWNVRREVREVGRDVKRETRKIRHDVRREVRKLW